MVIGFRIPFRGISQILRQLYYRVLRKPVGMVRLPAGFFVKVRRLDLYELDAVPFNDPGPFRYPYIINGRIIERVYDLSQWPEPPKAPDVPEDLCQEGSMEWALWRVYNTYAAALAQRIKQIEAAEAYGHDVARYILANCLSDLDRTLVQTPNDYEAILAAAICPEVKLADLETVLNRTFKATFEDKPVLEQVLSGKGSAAKVDALRLWASQAREAWKLSKEKWAGFSIREQAEMIVTVKLPGWLEALEWDKRERERKNV